MSLNDIPLLSALTERMKWLTQRQKVLSENVANANSPGYKAKDLAPQTFKDLLPGDNADRMHLASTDPGHIKFANETKTNKRTTEEVYEVSPTGNSVVLEAEMLKVAETQLEYQMTTSLYKKHMAMYKTALGRR